MFSEFENECLTAHNEYRDKHRVPRLQLDKTLSAVAQQWANHIAQAGVMQHRPNNNYGENIFMYSSSSNNVPGKMPVDLWYSEIKHFQFGREPSSLAAGHFTQVVWRGSERLGVGISTNRRGQVFVVANYDPPGNYTGRYAANVPPPK